MVDPKKELEANLWPIIQAIVETFGSDIGNLGRGLAELKERQDQSEETLVDYLATQESMIQPILAQRIVGTIVLGIQVCASLDELKLELPDELKAMVIGYGKAAEKTLESVQAVIVEDEEDDDPEEEDDFEKAAKTSIKPEMAEESTNG